MLFNRGPELSEFDRRPRNLAPTTLAQWAERSAIADIFNASPLERRLRGAFFVERRGTVIGYGAPGIDSLMINRVFAGGEGDGVNPDHVASVVGRFVARGVSRFFVHVHDHDQSPALIHALGDLGLVRYRRAWLKLLRAPGMLIPCETDLSIVAATHEDAHAFAWIAVQTHALDPNMAPAIASLVGRPGWHAYMACDQGMPVAVGMLMVRGDVGYLNFAGTLPAWRGRGAQSALLDKRMRVAFALGCRRVVAETGAPLDGESNASLHNLLRLGMQVVGVRENFAPKGTTWR